MCQLGRQNFDWGACEIEPCPLCGDPDCDFDCDGDYDGEEEDNDTGFVSFKDTLS